MSRLMTRSFENLDICTWNHFRSDHTVVMIIDSFMIDKPGIREKRNVPHMIGMMMAYENILNVTGLNIFFLQLCQKQLAIGSRIDQNKLSIRSRNKGSS